MSTSHDAADSQLDELLNRIQALTGDSTSSSESPKRQSTPTSAVPATVASASGPDGPRSEQPAKTDVTGGMTKAGGPTSQVGSQTSRAGRVERPAQARPSNPNLQTPRPAHVATPNPPVSSLAWEPSRDEPWRPTEPNDLRTARINESLLEAIIFRFLINAGEAEGRRVADQVQLPFRLIEPILERLKKDNLVAYKHSTATNDYIYVLTEAGRGIARGHMADCTYYGSCPVRLPDYIASVKHQSIEGQYPKRDDLTRAFNDLLINPKMLRRLGPAIASGRGMFLFGFPGNGKTSIAERVTGAFGKYIWVPRAIDIDGDIMRVYDPLNHVAAVPESGSGLLDSGNYDKRWIRIERPTIVAGGELTMAMLEVLNNSTSNVSESPLQLKSNCGTLVIDDFGRQKMSVDQLLNRWIIPLEKRYDFLNMASGKKIQVPFDQLVIFSTNLEPKDLVDDAFLRRIPYKIEVENPPEEDFRKLFEIMCKVTKIPYDFEAIDYLIKTHYLPINRPFRNCQPRDLLLQVRNYCLYNDLQVELKKEYFDFACENYFSVM
ncbi:MAG: AAA family ATPase [Planctomycetota bacterium]